MSLLENFKNVASLIKAVGNMDLYEKILDLQGETLQIQSDFIEKDNKIKQMEKQINQLQDKLKFKGKLIYLDKFYFEEDKDGKLLRDVYCPSCWEINKTPIHLHQTPTFHKILICPNCKHKFDKSGVYNILVTNHKNKFK